MFPGFDLCHKYLAQHIITTHMFMCNCDFFSLGHISSCSHSCPNRRVGWAQFDRRAHVARGLGAIRAVCRAWQAFYTFSALGTLEANPRVSATSSGIGFLHPLSPCTHVTFGCKPGFSARRGYTHISPIFAQSTTLRSCLPAAVQPPSNSSLQLYARAAAVVVGDYFDRSLQCSTCLYATTSRCCCFCCFCQVTCRRKV